MKLMGRWKYKGLYEYLKHTKITLTFQEIEEMIGEKLPKGAYNQLKPYDFWRNDSSSMDHKKTQVDAWFGAGWQVGVVGVIAENVVFIKVR